MFNSVKKNLALMLLFLLFGAVPAWAGYTGPTCGFLNENKVKMDLSVPYGISRMPMLYLTVDDVEKQAVVSAFILIDESTQGLALRAAGKPVKTLGFQFTMNVHDKKTGETTVYDSVCAHDEMVNMDMGLLSKFTRGLIELRVLSVRSHGIDIEAKLPREIRVGVMTLAKGQIAKSHFAARASFQLNPKDPTDMRTVVRVGDVVGEYEHLSVQFGAERGSFLTFSYPQKIAAVGLRKIPTYELVGGRELDQKDIELPVVNGHFDEIIVP